MPLYIYKCEDEKCSHTFEENRSMAEREAPIECPKCSTNSKRQFDPSAGSLIMWDGPDRKRPWFGGPTGSCKRNPMNGSRYTVKDVATENQWKSKMGLEKD